MNRLRTIVASSFSSMVMAGQERPFCTRFSAASSEARVHLSFVLHLLELQLYCYLLGVPLIPHSKFRLTPMKIQHTIYPKIVNALTYCVWPNASSGMRSGPRNATQSKSLDRTLRDIRNDNRAFGGLTQGGGGMWKLHQHSQFFFPP